MIPFIFSQFSDDDGNPLANGTLTFYATTTTDPLDTYTSEAGDVANQNPLSLDSAGRATIFLGSDSYDIILKDSLGNTVGTLTGVSGSGGGGGTSDITVVNTLADLRALAAGSSNYILLAGGTAVGDGASYFYYWDPDSIASDNGVSVIEPDSSPGSGRWLILNINNYKQSTFTGTFTGFAAPVTGACRYIRNGNLVTLTFPIVSGTSNSANFGMSGVPAAIRPTSVQCFFAPFIFDSTGYLISTLTVSTDGTIVFGSYESFTAVSSAFSSSGLKGISAQVSVTYTLV